MDSRRVPWHGRFSATRRQRRSRQHPHHPIPIPIPPTDHVITARKTKTSSKQSISRTQSLTRPRVSRLSAKLRLAKRKCRCVMIFLGHECARLIPPKIWFQNRRQNDRRRSRPLEPSSSASLMSSSSTMSDPLCEEESSLRDIDSEPIEKEQDDCLKSDGPATPELTSDATAPELLPEETPIYVKSQTRTTTESTTQNPDDTQTGETAPTEASNTQQTGALSQSASQPRTSWISNRRSASFVRCSEDYAPEVITFPNAPMKPAESPKLVETPSSSRLLKRVHSFVRLSTNEDGTARIVTDLDKTPSPPHPKTNIAAFSRAATGLRRSYSAAGLNDRLAAAARGEPSPKMPRTLSNIGRSRDSRAWEFWCDPDSRSTTSLTTRAEQEGSGSAADAIGILRASRKILAQNQARQNTPIISRHGSHNVLGSPCVKKSRGSMQRASTISGRISTKEYKKSGDETESDDFPQTESDKENWEPEVAPASRRHQVSTPPAARRARQILGENTDVMSQNASLGALLARDKGKGILDPEQDDELRSFMGGDGLSGRTSLGSAEEAGCVEGLLKLSQGQWR
jgi:hypothetical protein